MRSARTVAALALMAISMRDAAAAGPRPEPSPGRAVMALLKARCVKCHGPGKHEAELNLSTPKGLARGGESGEAVVRGKLDESLLWERVAADEMPPKDPLDESEKALLKSWIERGAPGLPEPSPGEPAGADHWAFKRLERPEVPAAVDPSRVANPIDHFIQAALDAAAPGVGLTDVADRATLLRRVSFDLTGLPPTPAEMDAYAADAGADAHARMVDRLLASPRLGERWGKRWLDAAGYAESNGHFSADSERPLAWRYRDYVVRSFNDDVPLDQFVREQLAGDEIAGYKPGMTVTPEVIRLLEATHFLRNSQDGTGESDGNPDEVRADKYAALEGAEQILASSLMGMTFQCARCHDHKFEPISHHDYYRLQAVLAPAFDLNAWVKPNDRVVEAPLAADLARWEANSRRIDADLARMNADHRAWLRENREAGILAFREDFDDPAALASRWSPRAPGDDAPAGTPPVTLGEAPAPSAAVRGGRLHLNESGGAGNRWLSTVESFDWTPEAEGDWIQATFDLDAAEVGGKAAERIGYYIGLRDFNDSDAVPGGNILLDGDPAGGATVTVDYPGSDAKPSGKVGSTGYASGRNYGVRVTNAGKDKFRVEQVVDGVPEEPAVTLDKIDLPDGGFGFEYCCGRSFVVGRLRVETRDRSADPTGAKAKERADRVKAFDASIKAKWSERGERPGRIAWVTDMTPAGSPVHLLLRGNYSTPGPVVEPGAPAVLCDPDNTLTIEPPGSATTGRRLALARWLTKPGSRASSLLARVLVNRIWQDHFGTGLVATPDNFGIAGAEPSHPELLEYLAAELVAGGWRQKPIHRLILSSRAYLQSSKPRPDLDPLDPDARLLGRFPLRRLDAEAIRDAMLAASGELDDRPGGPSVQTNRDGAGEVLVPEAAEGSHRRSVYFQQRRTQMLSLLDVFDAPSIVTSCTVRQPSTIPLQSLSLLNSEFAAARGRGLADRLVREAGADQTARVHLAFRIVAGRPPDDDELAAANAFLAEQPARYPGGPGADARAWADFCQMLLASNAFLYVE
ncbi:PSD1 and planctomycete cytochrome C domain-containing protein [Isosphaeraceae bacterium EP7]